MSQRISCVIQGRLHSELKFLMGLNCLIPDSRAVFKAFQISSTVLSWKRHKISEDFKAIKDLNLFQSAFLYIGIDLGFCRLILGLMLTFEIEIHDLRCLTRFQLNLQGCGLMSGTGQEHCHLWWVYSPFEQGCNHLGRR